MGEIESRLGDPKVAYISLRVWTSPIGPFQRRLCRLENRIEKRKREEEKYVSTPVGPGQLVSRMGIKAGFLVLQRGFSSDCDGAISEEIKNVTGNPLVDEDATEVVDAVIAWWREDDGDLADELMDSLTYLSEDGAIWLLTPKVSRTGHVEPSDIREAAEVAALALTSTFPASQDWIATRLVTRKGGRK